MSNPQKKDTLPEHDQLAFKVIETANQRASLYDLVRQNILKVLTEGYEDYTSEIRREQRTLDDGTRITEEVKIKKPIQRFWMTVPEILEIFRANYPDLTMATTKVYYHLGKLHEQELLEQFPKVATGSKTRVRGRNFRTSAKFFVEVTVEASVGYSGTAVMPEEIGPRFVELARTVRESGVAASMEYQVNLDGVLLWVSMTMSRHSDGMNIIAVVRDITTHRSLEERLEKSEVEFGRLVEESFQGYAILQDSVPVFVNPAFAKTVGRTRSELNLMTPNEAWNMIHPDDRSILEERNKDLARGAEELPRHRLRYIRPDGTVRWVESFAMKTEHLGRPALLTLEIDITDQVEAEFELQRSERRFREIFDSSPVAIGRCDLEGRFVEMNQAHLDIFGISSLDDRPGYRLEKDPHVPKWALDQIAGGELVRFDVTYDFDLIRELKLVNTSKTGTIELVATFAPLNLPDDDPEAGYLIMVQDVTERLRAEEALQDNEERYRAFFEQASDSILITNPQTSEILDFNRQAHESPGYTEEEFRDLKLWDIDEVEDESGVEERHIEIAEKGDLVFETKHKSKSEEIKDVRVSARIVSFRDRLINQAIITDITEEKKAEERLRESEERFRTLVEEGSIGVLVFQGSPPSIVYSNPVIQRILGFSEQTMSYQNVLDLLEEDDREAGRNRLFDSLESEVAPESDYEYKVTRRDGSVVWIRTSPRLITLNKEPAYQVLIVDITVQKQNQEALENSEELYRNLVEHIPEVVWTADSKGHTNYISPNVKDTYGYTAKEIYDKGEELWFGRIHPEDIKRVKQEYEKLFETGVGFDTEYRIQRKDEEWIWLHDRTMGTYESEGEVFASGVFTDISNQKKSESIRAQQESEIDLYESLLRHDLRNDLGLILSYIEATQMITESPDDEVKGFLNSALATIERMTNFLKSFGRPQDVREVDVVDYIREIAKEAIDSEKGIQIKVTYEKETTPTRITAGGFLALVFTNLF
ncbi:MAG: PAS domain S-box protein [Candidatus Thorarchaeota archaeon]